MDQLSRGLLQFGPFRLSLSDYTLLRQDDAGQWASVALRKKSFDLLCYLIAHPGRLISQDELLSHIWPNIHVQPDGLKGHVLHLRTVLGDDPSSPRFIETVRGRGYRFIAALAFPRAPDLETPVRQEILVGRAGANRDLDTLLCRAEAGEAQLGFITGEAGIGKTMLMDDFAARAKSRGAVLAVSRCLPGGAEADAYYPIIEILSHLARSHALPDFLALLARIAPTWLVQLPRLMSESQAEGALKEVYGTTSRRMMRELCDLLEALAREPLLVLQIEDIHWADQPTLDLLNAIATRRLQCKLLLLVSLRMSGAGASETAARTLCQSLALYRLGKEIELAPLSRAQVGEYLASMAGQPAPLALLDELHARSEGNPLFMTAILEYFFKEELVALTPEGWCLTGTLSDVRQKTPPNLARIIEAEFEALSPRAQAVLNAACISEAPFSALVEHAATSLSEREFEDECETLLRRTGLIRKTSPMPFPNGRLVQRYVFRHALYREVVYERQSHAVRRAAHLAIGLRMQQLYHADLGNVAASLARHFTAAGQAAEAVIYLRMSARRALMRFAAREAAVVIEQALALTAQLPAQAHLVSDLELLEDLARIYAGSLDSRASDTYARLASLAAGAHPEIECRALLGLGFTLAWVDLDRSLQVLSQAAARSAVLPNKLAAARVRSFAHGWRNWALGWSEPDAIAFEEVLEEVRRSGDLVALNATYVDYTLLLFPSSRYREAHDLIASAFDFLFANGVEHRADISLPLWILRLGKPLCLMYGGAFGDAVSLYKSGVRSFLDNGDVGRAATLQFYEAFLHVHAHDYEGALALCAQAVEYCDVRGAVKLTPNEKQIELVVHGLAVLGLGRLQEAQRLFGLAREALAERKTLTAWYWGMALAWGMTDTALAQGDLPAAQRHSAAFWELAAPTRERSWRALAHECAARVALASAALECAATCLRAAWAETHEGALPLLGWRLLAVQASLAEQRGDAAGAQQARAASAAALAKLAATLPLGHPGRASLAQARLVMAPVRPEAAMRRAKVASTEILP